VEEVTCSVAIRLGVFLPPPEFQTMVEVNETETDTPWPESASELYRPSNRRFLAKLVPTVVDRGCHVVSLTDPYGRILGFLNRGQSQ
jgi:hypothetical protein